MKHVRLANLGIIVSAFLASAFQSITASAQTATDMGSMLSNASTQTYQGPAYILSVATFVIGATVAMWGVIRLKEFADGQVPARDGLWRIGGGSLLMALPFAVNAALNTFFGGIGYGSESNYATGGSNNLNGTATGNCNNGLDQCMVAFVKNIYLPAEVLINVACYIIGGICVAIGLYRLAMAGQGARGAAPATTGTVGYIGGGSVLISLGEFMDIIRNSIFGGATQQFNQLAFANNGSSLPAQLQTDANNVFLALFAWVQLIGWLAFGRGVYILIKASQGPGGKSHSQAFTHIIGGALAVNMYGFVNLIQTTLGISLVNGSP